MNVRIFWVRAMKCMCTQTRPRFILSSERGFGGMEFEPMLTPREKSPLPENFPRGGSNLRRCGQRAQTLPTSYSGPRHHLKEAKYTGSCYDCSCCWQWWWWCCWYCCFALVIPFWVKLCSTEDNSYQGHGEAQGGQKSESLCFSCSLRYILQSLK